MAIAVVIIHYGSASVTSECLNQLKSKINGNQLILVNNSPQSLGSLADIIPCISVENNDNLGFARAANLGIVRALQDPRIEAVLLMNNDLSFSSGSLSELLLTFAKKKSAGIVSPVLLHSDNKYDWGGQLNRWTGLVRHQNFHEKPKTIIETGHVAGAAMLIKREVVDKIGLLDDRFFMYYEDLDYCLRTRKAGYTIHINPGVVAVHKLSASSKGITRLLYNWRSHLKFINKHLGKNVMPTAYITDLFYYPLICLKSFFTTLVWKI